MERPALWGLLFLSENVAPLSFIFIYSAVAIIRWSSRPFLALQTTVGFCPLLHAADAHAKGRVKFGVMLIHEALPATHVRVAEEDFSPKVANVMNSTWHVPQG